MMPIVVISSQVVSSQMTTKRRRIGVMMMNMAGHGKADSSIHVSGAYCTGADVFVMISTASTNLAGLPLALLGIEEEPSIGQLESPLVRHGRLLPLLEHTIAVALGVDPVACGFMVRCVGNNSMVR